MNKFLQWVLNISAGLFFFFLFLFIFFPFEGVISHFISRVEKQTAGEYRITTGEIDPGIIFRTTIKNFQVHKMSGGADVVLIDMPEVKIGLGYLPLLAGQIKASFAVNGRSGKAEGDFLFSRSEYRIKADLEKMSFLEFPWLTNSMKIPLEGLLDGKIDLRVYPVQFTKNEGSVDLKLIDFKIPPSHVTPYSGFDIDLPETILSDSDGGSIKISLEKGKMEVAEIRLPGGDLAVNLSGQVRLNRRFELSRLNINGAFRISDKLREVFPLIMVVDKQKNEDGTYPLAILGRISRPQVRVGTSEIL